MRLAPINLMRLAPIIIIALLPLAFTGCGSHSQSAPPKTLAQARQGFHTHLLTQKKTPDPVPAPPAGFELVHYAAPLGSFPAYVALPAGASAGAKSPAIVWIAGGFDNSLGDTPWAAATPDNDQSARAFPQAGVLTLYPSLRGGNNNPGFLEGLGGEVDDALAAARYLQTRPDVDPKRIYLGGHSTGGTLALLCAEMPNPFRAVFAFGPVDNVADYGQDNLPFNVNDMRELTARGPILYLDTITTPTFAFEGTGEGNIEPLRKMCANTTNPALHFYEVPGQDHFSELAPVTPVVARQIASDTGPQPHFSFLSSNPQISPLRQ